MRIKHLFMMLTFGVVLSACVSDEERFKKELNSVDRQVSQSLETLKQHLKSNRLRNARLLTEYGSVVAESKPDMKSIVELLMSEGTIKGPIYQGLVARAIQARNEIDRAAKMGRSEVQKLLREYDSINVGSSTRNFNMALSDPVNVLADMSDGKLARITPLSEEASKEASVQAGAELVGNPHYGNWKTDSSGNTFWAWYGQYAFISHLFSGPTYYDAWSGNRRYSYYHDMGRGTYSSPQQKKSYRDTEARVKKQYSQSSKKFKSPYSKNLAPKSVYKPKELVASPNKFSSKYSSNNKSKRSNSSSSSGSKNYNSRSSSSSRSRSSRSGGK